MGEAVSAWIAEQQKSVEVSGRHATALRLVGPDERVWGQWPMKTADLADQVERLQNALAEQMPTGKHRAQLVIADNKGDQWASFPVVLHGRSVAASSAAQEAKTLQHASSIAIANLETVIEQQRNEITRLSERCDSLLEDQGQLIETIMSFQTQNTEVDIMVREYEERKAGRERLSELAGPLLAQFGGMIGPELLRKAKESSQRKAANGRSATTAAGQPANPAPVHGPVRAPEPKADGGANAPNGSAGSTNGAGEGPAQLSAQTPTPAKNLRAKGSPRKKPLPRKAKVRKR